MVDSNELPRLNPQKKAPAQTADKKAVSIKHALAVFFKKYSFLLIIPVLLSYFFICYEQERLMQTQIYACLREIGANGFGVTYEPPHFAFFGFKSGLYIDDLVIKAPQHFGGWTFKAGRITLSANPFSPNVLFVKVQGTHAVTDEAKKEHRFQLGKGDITVYVPTDKKQAAFDAVFENIAVVGGGPAIKAESLTVSAEELAEKIDDMKAFSYSFQLDRLSMPAGELPVPAEMEYLYAQGILRGISLKRQKALLDDWLSNSGTLEITKGEMIWNPLMAEFSATLGMTPAFQIMAASSAKVYGFFSFLTFLEKQNVLRASDLSVAKIVLGKKLKMENGESQPSLTSPFSLQFGKLYVGQILLYDFNASNTLP